MKWAIAILVLAVSPLVVNGAERGGSRPTTARAKRVAPAMRLVNQAPSAPPTNGRYWYQDSAGRWYLWSSGEWVSSSRRTTTADLSDTGLVAKVETPRVIISYPDDEQLDNALGIEWYKNGRGRFSD